MLTSLALIFLIGLTGAWICEKIRLPRIIGMLLVGIVIGPFVLNLLDAKILGISSELRSMALIIILIKAGLSLDLNDLKKVGRPALLMSFLPALFEIAAFVCIGPVVLKISRIEAAIIGAVLGAVSPAVVVPRMVQLMEERYGTDKAIPQMILAGASLDDVFVIVLFSTFTRMGQGNAASITDFINIPVSIVLGIALGIAVGLALNGLFELMEKHASAVRAPIKVIVLLGVALLLNALEGILEEKVAVSGLLAVMSMACAMKMRAQKETTAHLADSYGKIWMAAEVLLFVLVGAAVDIRYTMGAGVGAVLMIAIGLLFRSVGTVLCVLGTALNRKEKLYTIFAYWPKATVQAAIGAVPLSMGLACGNLTLSVAVLSILLTAPLGAIVMDASYKHLLRRETNVM